MTLHFNEPVAGGPGQRAFDVLLEGVIVLDDWDIFAEAGGQFSAVSTTVVTTVADGTLDVDFIAVVGGNALVSAVEVVQLP